MILTAAQMNAVCSDQNTLLTACPGSGKTRTLIAKLVREIGSVRGSPRSVLCVTYTNSATHEIESRLKHELFERDSQNFDVSTIHSFCLNYIFRPFLWRLPNFAGLPKLLVPDQPEFEEIARYAASQIGWHNLDRSDLEQFEGISRDSSGRMVGTAAQSLMLSRAAPIFQSRCAQLGFVDFGTLIYESYRLLRDHQSIRQSISSKFAWILIDEFQDTTDLQCEIFKLVHSGGRTKFFAVGDPSQSIFGFTGARPDLMENFGRHISARRDLVLNENFRSGPGIVEHAEKLLPRSPAMTSNLIGCNKNGPIYNHVSNYADAVVDLFLPMLAANEIPLTEAAILAPAWFFLPPIARKLRAFGVPVVGPGARPYRRSRVFSGLAEALCAATVELDHNSLHQLERALNFTIRELTGQSINSLFSYADRIVLSKLLRSARLIATRSLSGVGFLEAMAKSAAEIFVESKMISEIESGILISSVEEMKTDMRSQKIDIRNLSIEDLGLFAVSSKAIRLSTIHYAKGREYKAVAIVGLVQGSLPNYRAKTREELNDYRRLLYVAITRAKSALMYFSEEHHRNPPSQFLAELGVRK